MRFGGKAEMINVNNDIKRIFSMVGIFKIIPLVDEQLVREEVNLWKTK